MSLWNPSDDDIIQLLTPELPSAAPMGARHRGLMDRENIFAD